MISLYLGQDVLSRGDTALQVYTTDHRLQIDNNLTENAIRPVALGRKNYLFAGSHEAAQNAAIFYSLFATCKANGINPSIWLTDTLQKRLADILSIGLISFCLALRYV